MRYTAVALFALSLFTGNALTAPTPQAGGAVSTSNSLWDHFKRQISGASFTSSQPTSSDCKRDNFARQISGAFFHTSTPACKRDDVKRQIAGYTNQGNTSGGQSIHDSSDNPGIVAGN
ncbi:hypothetical protein LX36DRAFT_752020 [Colletotrichum falcatum]|nr:hypothetical protein LX36DRAFT_752020 [Colletotrichum falcatum]